MNDTAKPLCLEVAADPSAPAVIHAELRRWLSEVGVRGWVVDDLLVASDEISFEFILMPTVTRLEVHASLHEGVVHLDITSDRRRRREIRAVPWVTGVEVLDELDADLGLAYQVADTFSVHTFADHTTVELTKILT